MINFIKWELIDELKSKIILLFLIVIVDLLFISLKIEFGVISMLITSAYSIAMFATFIFAFIAGPKRTMDSYKKKTFLLESMIPLSPGKLLFCKYIISIIVNFFYSFLFILSLYAIMVKFNSSDYKLFLQLLFGFSVNIKTAMMKAIFLITTSTLAFTSLITLIYIFLKSLFPNGILLRLISYISCSVALISLVVKVYSLSSNQDIIYSAILFFIIICSYLMSCWLIENKLEVYN